MFNTELPQLSFSNSPLNLVSSPFPMLSPFDLSFSPLYSPGLLSIAMSGELPFPAPPKTTAAVVSGADWSPILESLPSLDASCIQQDDTDLVPLTVSEVGLAIPTMDDSVSDSPSPSVLSTEDIEEAPLGYRVDGVPRRRRPKKSASAATKQTDAYQRRRKKNTEAARRNRERKREESAAQKAQESAIEKENRHLRESVVQLRAQLLELEDLVRERVIQCYPEDGAPEHIRAAIAKMTEAML
jgi:hypothetical protein